MQRSLDRRMGYGLIVVSHALCSIGDAYVVVSGFPFVGDGERTSTEQHAKNCVHYAQDMLHVVSRGCVHHMHVQHGACSHHVAWMLTYVCVRVQIKRVRTQEGDSVEMRIG